MLAEVSFHKLSLLLIEIQTSFEKNTMTLELWYDLLFKDPTEFLLLFIDNAVNFAHQLFRVVVKLFFGLLAYAQQVAVVGHAHPEKFVQIGGVNCQKLDTLKQRHGGILGFL